MHDAEKSALLTACPFCAGTVEYLVDYNDRHQTEVKYIHCTICELRVDVSPLTFDEALMYWNGRPIESALREAFVNMRDMRDLAVSQSQDAYQAYQRATARAVQPHEVATLVGALSAVLDMDAETLTMSERTRTHLRDFVERLKVARREQGL